MAETLNEKGESKERDKVVTMPDGKTMERKLRKAGLYGETEEGDLVYNRFIEILADGRTSVIGLNPAWEIALSNMRGSPSGMRAQFDSNVNFCRTIDVLVRDPKARFQAIVGRMRDLEGRIEMMRDAQPTNLKNV